jgi:hypothetical protein
MKEDHTKRADAWQKDTELYVNPAEQSGLWRVLGNNSGFIYKDSLDEQQAKDYAAELNKNKETSKRYEDA